MSDRNEAVVSATIDRTPGQQSPTARFTMAEFVEFHMILDLELDAISSTENRVLGSIGFTALGAVMGLAGSFSIAISKIRNPSLGQFTLPDLVNTVLFSASIALAVLCLSIFFLKRWRNRGITEIIRQREKHRMPSGNI